VCIAQAAYLYAPLLVATALSAIVLRFDLWRVLRRPIDAHRSWRGIRLFGDNKTWRGVLVAVLGCTFGVAIQYVIGARAGRLALVEYVHAPNILLGVAMGVGVAAGELPNSFVKRRLRIAPGATAAGWKRAAFYGWDQIDLLTGAWPLVAIWVAPTWCLVVASVGLVLIAHPLISLVGYLVGARRTAR
jgi:CDP-2,3-bis-(O-geranylgeranyl)-sn-glycerol synthase